MRLPSRTTAVRILTAAAFLIVCVHGLSRFGFPKPLQLGLAVREQWVYGPLRHDTAVSVARCLLGWVPAFVIGAFVGMATGRLKPMAVIGEGPLTLLRAIPFISLVPISVRIFGLSEMGKILLVAYAAFGITWLIVHQAASSLPIHLVWRANVLGVTRTGRFRKILLPALSHAFSAAGRSSIALAWIVLGVAELGGVYERSSGLWWSEGLGYRLFRALDDGNDGQLLAAILTFAAIGLVGDVLFTGGFRATMGGIEALKRFRARRAVAATRRNLPGHVRTRPASGVLRVSGLCASYGEREVLRDLSFEVAAGETLAIVGPSGSGKTTLIRAIAHLLGDSLRTVGKIEVNGHQLVRTTPIIGVVFQDVAVFESLTVWENVTIGHRASHAGAEVAAAESVALLEAFGLGRYAAQLASELSGGEKQRLALAMILANDAEVLLLDEPFGALDALTRRRLQRYFVEHIRGRLTTVLVTHDLEEAALLGDRVRIGTNATADVIEVRKGGKDPFAWEREPDFAATRIRILNALEAGAGV